MRTWREMELKYFDERCYVFYTTMFIAGFAIGMKLVFDYV